MASQKIQGLSIKLSADTTAISQALNDVNKSINKTGKELNDVNRLLKLDPSNITLLTQKQTLLTESINKTKDKLKELNKVKELADNDTSVNKNTAEYRDLVKQIEKAKIQLAEFQKQQDSNNISLDQASSLLKDAGDSALTFGDMLKANVISDIVIGGLNALVSATEKVASAMINVVKAGVEYNAQMEQYTTSFTAMLGSEEEANKMLDSIKKSAMASPFDTASLVQANQLLLTTGESADKTQQVIKALGDAVAYTGGGNSELTRMASNLQQIKNVGKASSIDIKQFANAGINVYGMLAQSMGKSIDQVKDMDISYQDLTKALIKASEEGGIYFGAMERQSSTLTGQLNKMQSNWEALTGVIAEDTTSALQEDFIPAINEALESMINWEEEGFGSLGEAMSEGIADILTTIVEKTPDLIQGGIDLISEIAEGLLKKDKDGKSVLEKTFQTLTEKLLDFVTSADFYLKLLEIGVAIGKGILNGIINKLSELSDWLNESFSLDGQYITFGNIEPYMSGGYGNMIKSGGYGSLLSGGFASGGINLSTNINVTSNNVTQADVQGWARIMADTINEELGRAI